MESPIDEMTVRNMSPVSLAFVGDAVYSLYIRTFYTKNSTAKAGELHKLASQMVKAEAQSNTMAQIEEFLTEDEIYIFKRGRNAKTTNSAKNATLIQYKRATGFETLIGYLFLIGNLTRLEELLNKTTQRS